MTETIPTRITRKTSRAPQVIEADVCVVGAGISGISAAIEAARLGRRTVLVDAAPKIGGQAIGSIVGTLIGLFTHGPDAYQIIHGLAAEMVNELGAEGAMMQRRSTKTGTLTYQYDEVRLQRWIERKLTEAGVIILVGAALTGATMASRRLTRISLATRYGSVDVTATGFVDASGDAALAWEAGLPTREPEAPIYGSMNFLIEKFDTDAVKSLSMPEVSARLRSEGAAYGLVRHEGFLMPMPGMDVMLANITHFETPLDPVAAATMVITGHAQGDAVLRFLKDKFPAIFADARIRVYGNPGIRQTRWIVGRHQLTLPEIRAGQRPDDAVTRCAWWVELHDTKQETYWEAFADNHVYYIPLGCMVPADADNIVAAGRCVDADSHALSAIRVMGPCIAMGIAAAHALDLAGTGSVAQIDLSALQRRLTANLDQIAA